MPTVKDFTHMIKRYVTTFRTAHILTPLLDRNFCIIISMEIEKLQYFSLVFLLWHIV